MWPKFSAIFDAVEKGHRRILVRSANGVGKTTALAALCNWKLHNSKECIVLTTSSNEKQVRHNLWGEIRAQARRAGLYEPEDISDTRIALDDKRFMLAINPAKPESAQGYHAASILIAVDEATAVRREILSSLIATATGDDVLIVMIYNPMTADSFVYEAERSGEWKVITISAFEHPNITEEQNLIPGAVTADSTESRLALWSEPAAESEEGAVEFRGKRWRRTLEVSRRILGEWHLDAGEGLISRALLNASLTASAAPGVKTMGVDLALGGGDENVIARFDGGIQLPIIAFRTRSHDEIIRRIETEFKAGFTLIAIDETGSIGTITPQLAKCGITAHSVNFAEAATRAYQTRHRKLGNRRIEMYYHLMEELRRGEVRLLNDGKLLDELAAARLSTAGERETYYLEPKADIRKRLARSPDRADAVCLARYAPLIERFTRPRVIIVNSPGREYEGYWRG